jgi:hypothetical protein
MPIDRRYQVKRRSKAYLQTIDLRQKIKGQEILHGMNEIAAYMCVGPVTANNYVKKWGLPAMRLGGHTCSGNDTGEWVTTKSLINQWIAIEHYKYLDRNGLIDDAENEEANEADETPAQRAVG